jgi:XRE family transcriptional regulator, aerobic/anaerobic benzoate catabolism transcriptional regulator
MEETYAIYFFPVDEVLTPLGDTVRRLRQEQRLTLKTLAERSGLSLRFLSDLEKGRGNISIARLIQVARALGAPVAELVADLDAAKASSRAPLIALVGLRGAGKSTIGKRAADRLGVPFIELDARIEAEAGMRLAQIFEIYGEAYYRRLEREVLASVLEVSAGTGGVIATGGGIVMDAECWRMLRRRTKTIWLKARPEDHYRRVQAQGDLRPMKNRPQAMAELRALLGSRASVYAEADLAVDTSTLGLEGAIARVSEAGRASHMHRG